MKFLHEEVFPDGGYSALVKLYGTEWAVTYVAGEIRVWASSAVSAATTRNWKFKASKETVKKLIALKLKSFAPEWHAAHAALYAEPA